MAWDVKYRSEFKDILGLKWRIDIADETDATTITTMQPTGTPLTINYLSSSDSIIGSPIHGSTVDINVYADTDFQWSNFYDYGNQTYKVDVYYDPDVTNVLYWTGFINSEGYQEPYDGTAYPVVISASDGLGQLKNMLYKYTTTSEDDTDYNGRRLESQIIIDILGKIQHTGFTEYINIYEAEMSTGTGDSPMDQLKIDVDVFRDMNCYEVLEHILNKYNAVIRQVNGQMTIYRPLDLSNATLYGRIFTTSTTKTSTTINPLILIDRPSFSSDVNSVDGGTLMIQPPVKKVTINQDYGYKESWIDNYTFDKDDYYNSNFALWNLSPGATCSPLSIKMPNEKYGIIMLGTDPSKYIYQDFGVEAIIEASPAIFNFEFKYQYYSGVSTGDKNMTIPEEIIQIRNAAGNKFLYEIDSQFCGWTSTPSYISIAGGVIKPGGNGWNTYSRKVIGLPTAGTHQVRIYARDAGLGVVLWTAVKDVKFNTTADTTIFTRNKRKLKQRIIISGTGAGSNGEFQIGLRNKYFYTASDIKDNDEIVEKTYVKTNAIKGTEFESDYILGDVVGTNVGNVMEQFDGALCTYTTPMMQTLSEAAADFVTNHAAKYTAGGVVVTQGTGVNTHKILFSAAVAGTDSITGATTITNTSGDLTGSVSTQANVTAVARIDEVWPNNTDTDFYIICNGHYNTAFWNTNLATTIHYFVNSNPNFGAVTVEAYPTYIKFTANNPGTDFVGTTSIIDAYTADPAGTVYYATANRVAVKRVDTVTLSSATGVIGTANIVCDAQTARQVALIEKPAKLIPTTVWNSRGGSENKAILEIIGDEIAYQYSRPTQQLSLPILELNATSNIPDNIKLLGCYNDVLNTYVNTFNINRYDSIFDVNDIPNWSTYMCNLTPGDGYTRYTATGPDSHMYIDTSFKGLQYFIIEMKYRMSSGAFSGAEIYYKTKDHGRLGSYYKQLSFIDDDEWHTATFDMRELQTGGLDWYNSIITGVWFDLIGNASGTIDIEYIGVNRKFVRDFVINSAVFNVRDRQWLLDLIEVIA